MQVDNEKKSDGGRVHNERKSDGVRVHHEEELTIRKNGVRRAMG